MKFATQQLTNANMFAYLRDVPRFDECSLNNAFAFNARFSEREGLYFQLLLRAILRIACATCGTQS
jgi:hypothetical protein